MRSGWRHRHLSRQLQLGNRIRSFRQLFYRLAGRETHPEALAARFQGWREFEAGHAQSLGASPAVHG